MDFTRLATEQINRESAALDTLSVEEAARLMNRANRRSPD